MGRPSMTLTRNTPRRLAMGVSEEQVAAIRHHSPVSHRSISSLRESFKEARNSPGTGAMLPE